MFVSSTFLSIQYGVDEAIARFFVDREPPANNLYWHEKLLYLRPVPGYLFIPLIVDLLFKLGIEKQQLLSEEFVTTIEDIGHVSAMHEFGQITNAEVISKCVELVKDECGNNEWVANLTNYLLNTAEPFFKPLATPFRALHRGDIFLYSICKLDYAEELNEKIVETWFALISTLLLLDDAEDIESDRKTGDENAFLESGLNTAGIEAILELLRQNLRKIATLNGTMARTLDDRFKELIEKPYITQYLNKS